MRTVKQLKEELDKFPDDALCYAYEGLSELCAPIQEPTGIVIVKNDKQGIIHCTAWKGIDAESTVTLDD